jgi:hypothetical protein
VEQGDECVGAVDVESLKLIRNNEIKYKCRTQCNYTDVKETLKFGDNKVEHGRKNEVQTYERTEKMDLIREQRLSAGIVNRLYEVLSL